jgi:HD-GYP domain-containing protein (c-di-GMP phosphodiesterase class II)
MSIESRLLAMADMFAAMAENRPYRGGLEPAKILEILGKEVPNKLDPLCFEALHRVVERWDWLAPAEPTKEVGEFSRSHPKRFLIEDELAQLI